MTPIKKKLMALIVVLCVVSIPLMAVVSGHSLHNSLWDLSGELRTAYNQLPETRQRFDDDYEQQHQRLLDVISGDISEVGSRSPQKGGKRRRTDPHNEAL